MGREWKTLGHGINTEILHYTAFLPVPLPLSATAVRTVLVDHLVLCAALTTRDLLLLFGEEPAAFRHRGSKRLVDPTPSVLNSTRDAERFANPNATRSVQPTTDNRSKSVRPLPQLGVFIVIVLCWPVPLVGGVHRYFTDSICASPRFVCPAALPELDITSQRPKFSSFLSLAVGRPL